MTDIRLPAKLRPLAGIWTRPEIRHAAIYGGRGSAKSHSVATLWLLRGMEHRERVLCFREIQKSIRDSVHRLLTDKINDYGLGPFYEVTRDEIRGANGTLFLFTGLRDHTADSVKSYEGLTGAWGEEAHTITEDSALKLIPTVRGCDDPKIIWTWNPENESDYVHNRFVVRGDPTALVIKMNHRDNPWFPPALEAERQHLLAINEDLHNHVWEGECRSAAGLLFKRHWFKWYDRAPDRLNTYLASDYAVTQDGGDWTEHGVGGLDDRGELWLLDWW
ncbi:MAG TPA: PBSX family phage terminase large subunit, partial [Xanthomonadaceae bacterium]|nr:PBSX family phage terminase large subunit [Xanthomonadaceae bacterium]